jgi:hypothetical protein
MEVKNVNEKPVSCPLCSATFSTVQELLAHLAMHQKAAPKYVGEGGYSPPEWAKEIPERAIVQEGENRFKLTGFVRLDHSPFNPERQRLTIGTDKGLLYTSSLSIMVALKRAAESGPLEGKTLYFKAAGSGPSRRYSDVRVE